MKSNNRYIGIGKTVLVAVAAVALWAGPAAATRDLTATVIKNKDVTVNVTTIITKNATVTVDMEETYEGSAQADALANVVNTGNEVGPCESSCENGPNEIAPGELDFGIELTAILNDSVNDNEGIVGVNQDVGNMVNQANILSFARVEFTTGTDEDPSHLFSNAQAEVDQVNTANMVTQEEVLVEPLFDDPDHEATIEASIQDNNGIVGVNQNTGNMNNQTNAVALVVGEGNATALTEAALGQENSENFVEGIETVKIDTISGSINNNAGVVSVNQSVGNMNNQGSAIAFGALKTSATIGVPGT